MTSFFETIEGDFEMKLAAIILAAAILLPSALHANKRNGYECYPGNCKITCWTTKAGTQICVQKCDRVCRR